MSEVQVNVGQTETLVSRYGHSARVHNQLKGFEGEATFWGFDLDGVQGHYAYYTRESAEDAAINAVKNAPEPATMQTLIEQRNKLSAQLREMAKKTEPKDITASWGAFDYISANATDPTWIYQSAGFHFLQFKDGVVFGEIETGVIEQYRIEDWTFENISLQEEVEALA